MRRNDAGLGGDGRGDADGCETGKIKGFFPATAFERFFAFICY
jgi:hypothetical protein